MNKFIKFYIKRNENLFLSFCFAAWSQNKKKKVRSLVQTSDPASHWCTHAFTHACNSNQLIILARKEGNLPGHTMLETKSREMVGHYSRLSIQSAAHNGVGVLSRRRSSKCHFNGGLEEYLVSYCCCCLLLWGRREMRASTRMKLVAYSFFFRLHFTKKTIRNIIVKINDRVKQTF